MINYSYNFELNSSRLLMRKILFSLLVLVSLSSQIRAEDGYRLWLRYDLLTDQKKLALYHQLTKGWFIEGTSPTLNVARQELLQGLNGLLGSSVPGTKVDANSNGLIAGTPKTSSFIASLNLSDKLKAAGQE